MIVDAADPGTAKCRVLRFGKDQRIFDRNAGLIVVAVQHPSLELIASQSPFMHHLMVGMLVVVAAHPFVLEPLDELCLVETGLLAMLVHSTNSMPS